MGKSSTEWQRSTKEIRDKAVSLVAAGWTHEEAAKEVGFSRPAVTTWVRRKSVKERKPQ